MHLYLKLDSVKDCSFKIRFSRIDDSIQKLLQLCMKGDGCNSSSLVTLYGSILGFYDRLCLGSGISKCTYQHLWCGLIEGNTYIVHEILTKMEAAICCENRWCFHSSIYNYVILVNACSSRDSTFPGQC